MIVGFVGEEVLAAPSRDALLLPARELRHLLDRHTRATPDLRQNCFDFSPTEAKRCETSLGAARCGPKSTIDDLLEDPNKPGLVCREAKVEIGEGYSVHFRFQRRTSNAAHESTHGFKIMSTFDERRRRVMNALGKPARFAKEIVLLPGNAQKFPCAGLPDEATSVIADFLNGSAVQHRMAVSKTGRVLASFYLSLAYGVHQTLSTNAQDTGGFGSADPVALASSDGHISDIRPVKLLANDISQCLPEIRISGTVEGHKALIPPSEPGRR